MKRFVISAVLIFCVFVECYTINFLAEKAMEEIKQALLSCTEKENEASLNVLKIKTALSVWDKNKKILHLFMTGEDFSELKKNMVSMEYLCDFPEYDEIARISGESAIMLENMRDVFRIKAENIF